MTIMLKPAAPRLHPADEAMLRKALGTEAEGLMARLGTGAGTSVLSNYFGNLVLEAYLYKYGGYLALHTDDPTVTGDPATELGGGGYMRQRITFNHAAGKAVVSNNKQTFVGVPASKITYMAVWDAQVGGHMLCSIALAEPLSPTDEAHFLAAAGDVGIQL